MTESESVELRFSGKDGTGQPIMKSLKLPIYEEPLQVGPAVTVKAGREVALRMALDEAFQRDVAGSFDALSWRQVPGPELVIENASSSVASFTAPPVEQITRYEFIATASASQSGMTLEASKVVFIVPESQWVDAVAIHNTDGPAAVLRADSSLLMIRGFAASAAPGLLTFDFPADSVEDIDGSLDRVIAVFKNGTAKTLYSRAVTELGERDPFAGIANVQSVAGTRYADARDMLYYLSSGGDFWWLVSNAEGDFSLRNQNIAKIFPGLGSLRLMRNGELRGAGNSLIANDVRHAAGTSSSVAYILQDGTFGHTRRPVPSNFFAAPDEYIELESNSIYCELVFALRKDGGIDGFTPAAHPLPPDLQDIRSIKSGCSSPMVLRKDGTVLTWFGVYGNEDSILSEIISGEKPAPWNLVDPSLAGPE